LKQKQQNKGLLLPLICGVPEIVLRSVSLSRTDATRKVAITCTNLKRQKAENIKFIFTVGRRNWLREMRKCGREKEKNCEEEGYRVVS
jgi:hypothetical protein